MTRPGDGPRPTRLGVGAVALAAALAALAPTGLAAAARNEGKGGPSVERTLRDVQETLQVFESRVEQLAAKYASDRPAVPSVYRLQSRINDGLVFFQLNEFERASILLMEVVQDPVNQGYAGYKDAVFYLAESLYRLHNPIAANQFYQLVVERNYKQYRKDALLRLIEIAMVTQQPTEALDRYFTQLNAEPGAAGDPRTYYVHAKSLYFRGAADQALQEFAAIRADSEHFHRARYFIGTILVSRRQLVEALPYFQQVASEPSRGKETQAIKELAHLALGRLLYELGRYPESIREYQLVSRDAAVVDRALYEVAWTHIKQKDHQQALRALDILLLAAPDSTLAPEATLLKGNLQLELLQYAEAQTTFQEIVERFGPVRERLEIVLQEHADPESFFHQLLGRNLDRFDVQVLLPPLATSWVKEEERVGEALGVVEEIEGTADELTEASELILRLEDALSAENRIEIFPDLSSAWKSMLETENSLLVLKTRLTEAEKSLVWDHASPAERQSYAKIGEQRGELERRFKEIPLTAQGLAKREAKVEGQIEELDIAVFRLSVQIDALQAQLVAMEKWISDTASTPGARSRGSEGQVRASVREQRLELEQLESQLVELRHAIVRQRGGVGVGDAVNAAEIEIKQRYERVLADEASLLRTLSSRLAPEQQQLVARADQLRGRIQRSEETIRRFYTVVRKTVDEKVHALRAQVEEEKKLISRYGRQVEGYQGMGENLAGRITADSFRTVQTKFRSLVLQADVGVIDVAWQKKEEKTRSYLELVRERKAELESLDTEFKPVLEEKL